MEKDKTITIEEMVRKDPALAYALVRGWERKVLADDRDMCSFDYIKGKWVAPVQCPKSLGELCLEIVGSNLPILPTPDNLVGWYYEVAGHQLLIHPRDCMTLRYAMYRRNK